MKYTLTLTLVIAVLAVGLWFVWRQYDTAGEVLVGAGAQPGEVAEVDLVDTDPETPTDVAATEERQALELESAEEEAPADDYEVGFLVEGRVIDDRRRPIEGATVELLMKGRAPGSVRTDPEGRYRFRERPIEAAEHADCGVLATTEDGRAGVRFLMAYAQWRPADEPTRVPVHDIVLGPGRSAVVRVLDAGQPVAGAEVAVEVGFDRILVGLGESDADGRVDFPLIPHGALVAMATRGHRRGEAVLPRGAPADRILAVELDAARTLDVEVVDQGTGAPVAGAEVRVERNVMPPRTFFRGNEAWVPQDRPAGAGITASDGHARVRGLPPGERLRLFWRHADYPGGNDDGGGWGRARIEADQTSIQVELERLHERTIRWPVVDGEVPVPQEGSELVVRPMPGSGLADHLLPALGVLLDGEVMISGVKGDHFRALVVARDGALARLWADPDAEVGSETSFRRPRTIVVNVVDVNGDPVEGARVCARNQGNNQLSPFVPTDTEGRAVLEGLYGGLADVWLSAPGSEGWGEKAGAVDLEAGDGEVNAVLPDTGDLWLRLLLDGRPGLPTSLFLRPARIVEEEPDTGRVRVELRVPDEGATASVYVEASGWLADPIAITRADFGSATPIDVPLSRAGSLLASVERAEGARVEIAAMRWDEDSAAWQPADFFRLKYPNAEEGGFRFEDLQAGRYRVRDQQSGVASEEVFVDLVAGEQTVHLDLTTTREITGTIEVPEGTDLTLARVLVEGEDVMVDEDDWVRIPGVPNGITPRRDGTFKTYVPVDREITLRAWHPVLSAASEGGTQPVGPDTDEVVLRLEAGAVCTFDVPEGLGRDWREALHVQLYRGDVGGEPVSEHAAPVADGTASFGGFEPGTYTLWIDPRKKFAPIVFEGVELGAAETDLGALGFVPGSSVRIHMRVPAGESAPRIYASGSHVGTPPYWRSLNSRGEAEVVLSGFGPGTFRVRGGTIMGQSAPLIPEREIVLDGEHDEVIEIDLEK